jgi:hypothetical protein
MLYRDGPSCVFGCGKSLALKCRERLEREPHGSHTLSLKKPGINEQPDRQRRPSQIIRYIVRVRRRQSDTSRPSASTHAVPPMTYSVPAVANVSPSRPTGYRLVASCVTAAVDTFLILFIKAAL